MSNNHNTYKCIVTGAEKYIPPSLLKNKIKKFGDVDSFRQHYVSKEAKKLLKSGNTVPQVREILGAPDNLPEIDIKILYRLKLVNTRTRKGNKEAQQYMERQIWLNSAEFKNKKRAHEQRIKNMSFQEWVEENTGGPNRLWLSTGRCTGTCIRPDIFVSHNNKSCDGCPYHEYCLCRNKRLSHEKRSKRQ